MSENKADEKIFDTIMNFFTLRNSDGQSRIERLATANLVQLLIEDLRQRGFLKRVGFSEGVKKDNINPDHYKVGGIEVWDYMKAKLTPTELAGAVKFNVIKYVSRCDHKGKIEDLKKARWYLDKLIQEIENGRKQ